MTDLSSLDGFKAARDAVEKYTSSRAKYLGELEAFVDGTQYVGRPDWFEDGEDAKPLWERAPCFVYPIVKSAIGSNADLLFGEGRFPVITARPSEDDAKVNEDGLTTDQSEILDRFILEIVRQVRFGFVCRQAFAQAQSTKSACALFGVRNGRFFIDMVKARHCTPTFDANKKTTKLVVEYPYFHETKVNGKRCVKALLFRREVDDKRDVTMFPFELRADIDADPEWKEDPAQTFEHGLGFCPVHWFAHMKSASVVNDFDGQAIHENLLDEIRALDFSISQRHRAALYTGDPQWTEAGVDDDAGPRATGRTASVPATANGGKPSSENPQTGRFVSVSGPKRARRKSPGVVWKYESADVKVQLHTLPPGALEALSQHAKDLRSKICESLSVVFFDADDFGNASDVSGRALEARKARQIEACDLYREDFGYGFMVPGICMLLRIAATIGKRAGSLRIAALKEALPVLSSFVSPDGWLDPSLSLQWGPYVRPSADDEMTIVAMVKTAREASPALITRRTAVDRLRGIFHIEDVDAYLATLEEEAEANQERAMKTAQAMGKPDADAPPAIKPKDDTE